MENQDPLDSSKNPGMDPQQINQQFSSQFGQVHLPYAVAVLVLGIVSIVTCFCYGLPGLICGIVALILSGKARAAYLQAPERYTRASYNNMKAGKICAIVGVCLSSLMIIYVIIWLAILGAALSSAPLWNFR